MTDIERDIVSRQFLLDWLGVSDSTERRMRRDGRPWPPHLLIGGRVCYRRSAVEAFLCAQECSSPGVRPELPDTVTPAGAVVAPAPGGGLPGPVDATRTTTVGDGHHGGLGVNR